VAQENIELFLRKRLRLLRNTAKLTQENVAEMAGISSAYYQSIEIGRRSNVSIRMVNKIAHAYGLTIAELFSAAVPCVRLRKTPYPSPHYKRVKR